jgi:hypothetical protein
MGRVAGTDVGTYAFNLGTLTAGTNYTLSLGGANTFAITAKPVTVTADTKTKVFGQVDPALTYTVAPALVGGDSFTGALARAAGTDVGDYAITQDDLALSANYALTYVGANLTITAKPVTVTPNANQTKVYGQADPVFAFANTALEGEDSISGAMGRVAGTDVGTYAFNLGTLSAGTNYTLSLGGANTFAITAKPVTVTPNANQTKVYGQADPVFAFANTALEGEDSISGAMGRVAGTEVGTYAFNLGTLTAGTNYTLSLGGANTFAITAKPVTVTPNANQTKVYGQADPVFAFANTALEGEDSISGAMGRVAGTDVGTYAFNLGTLTAGTNYTLSLGGANTFAITAKNITGAFTANDKIYDGNTDAVVTGRSLVGAEGGDDVSLTGGAADFDTKNVDNGKTVTLVGATLAGADAGNYNLTSVATDTANVTAKELTVTGITANNKVFDGNATASLNVAGATLAGVIDPDVVTLNTTLAAGTFVSANIGNNIVVTVSALAIGGADAGNYSLTQPTATASIFADMTLPSVTLNNPNGGEGFISGATTVIVWNATDNLTPAANLVLALTYSTNGGTSWNAIAFDGVNDGAFTWTVPAVTSPTCLVRLTATDGSGNVGADTSNAVFAISSPMAPDTTIDLVAGWNLVSLQKIPSNSAIETVLADVLANVQAVWSYNAATSTWSSWAPAAPSSLTTMTDGKGYWIQMSQPGTITVTGVDLPAPPQTPPTYSVSVGWNLIGFKSTTGMTAAEYLAGINGNYTKIYTFDGVSFTVVRPTDNLAPGFGYWVAVVSAGTIYP